MPQIANVTMVGNAISVMNADGELVALLAGAPRAMRRRVSASVIGL
jgi:hypothetical protein